MLQDKEQIKQDLLKIDDIKDRFVYIINLGKEQEEFSQEEHDDKFLIKGCNSQLWLIPKLVDSKVYFKVDSDAAIPKGLASLLAKIYSGLSPAEILSQEVDFLEELGIREHVSMNRRNGLSLFLKQLKLYALVYQKML